MNEIVKFDRIKEKIITLRNKNVILDSEVAELYGVQTKHINEAVMNNPDKFPSGYIFETDKEEADSLRSKISTLKKSGRGQHSKYLPKAFTEHGLYMLATILKSPTAEKTILDIIDTFAEMRELQRTVAEITETDDKDKQKELMQCGGKLINGLLGDHLTTTDIETTLEVNLAMLKVKHKITRTENNKK